MATTTNYGWTTPDDTALVKDGAAAIRTLGSSVDTTTKNLNPGTTAGDLAYYTSSTAKARIGIGSSGQALTVVAGVPAWANSATSTLTAKGDVLTATAANTIARLGVGANDTVLTADSTAATGLKWAVPAAGMTSIASGTLSGASVTISSIPGTYNSLLLSVNNYYVSAAARCYVRLNGSASGYTVALGLTGGTYAAVAASTVGLDMGGDTNVATTTNNGSYALQIFNYSGTNHHPMQATVQNSVPNSSGIYSYHSSVTAAITSIVLAPVSGSWSGGTYTLWGIK